MGQRWQWIVLSCVMLSACSSGASSPKTVEKAAHAEPIRIALAVPDRSNAAPSLAAWGSTVAAVWTASTDKASDIYLSVSTDEGAHFGTPVRVNDVDGDARASGEQAARVAIGASRVIHVAWPSKRDGHAVILYASSSDNGRTFSAVVPIAGATLSGARGWHALTLGYDGAVHAVWLDGRNAPPMTHHDHSAAAKSEHTDGGPRQDLFQVMWKDGGPRQEVPIAANVCFCCKTAIAASGEHVYVAWRHIFPGSVRDIALAESKDNGATFGAPLRVSEDGWQLNACPDDGPAMVADSHGGIHIAWPTLVPGATPHKEIFYSAIEDQKPLTPRLRMDSGDTEPAHPQIGADIHGNSIVVWDEHAGDTRRIALRPVSHGAVGPIQTFEGPGFNYPVVAAGEANWIVLWSSQTPDGRAVLEGRRLPFETGPTQ
jgi:hypothetical protein